MLVLKVLILLWRERAEESQMGRRVLNACLALLTRLSMSSSVLPCLLMTLPRQTNFTSFRSLSWSVMGSCFLLFIRITTVFLVLILRPVFSASSARWDSFSCTSWCLGERRLTWSLKFKSFSCLTNFHCMLVFLSDVACFIIQSTPRRKMVGDSKQP